MRYYLDQFADKYVRPRRQVHEEALALVKNYRWPGNIRELRNVAERLIIRSRATVIGVDQVRACGIGASAPAMDLRIPDEGLDLENVERRLVVAALEKAEWNQKRAAALLRISPDRMNARVKKFNIRNPNWRVNR